MFNRQFFPSPGQRQSYPGPQALGQVGPTNQPPGPSQPVSGPRAALWGHRPPGQYGSTSPALPSSFQAGPWSAPRPPGPPHGSLPPWTIQQPGPCASYSVPRLGPPLPYPHRPPGYAQNLWVRPPAAPPGLYQGFPPPYRDQFAPTGPFQGSPWSPAPGHAPPAPFHATPPGFPAPLAISPSTIPETPNLAAMAAVALCPWSPAQGRPSASPVQPPPAPFHVAPPGFRPQSASAPALPLSAPAGLMKVEQQQPPIQPPPATSYEAKPLLDHTQPPVSQSGAGDPSVPVTPDPGATWTPVPPPVAMQVGPGPASPAPAQFGLEDAPRSPSPPPLAVLSRAPELPFCQLSPAACTPPTGVHNFGIWNPVAALASCLFQATPAPTPIDENRSTATNPPPPELSASVQPETATPLSPSTSASPAYTLTVKTEMQQDPQSEMAIPLPATPPAPPPADAPELAEIPQDLQFESPEAGNSICRICCGAHSDADCKVASNAKKDKAYEELESCPGCGIIAHSCQCPLNAEREKKLQEAEARFQAGPVEVTLDESDESEGDRPAKKNKRKRSKDKKKERRRHRSPAKRSKKRRQSEDEEARPETIHLSDDSEDEEETRLAEARPARSSRNEFEPDRRSHNSPRRRSPSPSRRHRRPTTPSPPRDRSPRRRRQNSPIILSSDSEHDEGGIPETRAARSSRDDFEPDSRNQNSYRQSRSSSRSRSPHRRRRNSSSRRRRSSRSSSPRPDNRRRPTLMIRKRSRTASPPWGPAEPPSAASSRSPRSPPRKQEPAPQLTKGQRKRAARLKRDDRRRRCPTTTIKGLPKKEEEEHKKYCRRRHVSSDSEKEDPKRRCRRSGDRSTSRSPSFDDEKPPRDSCKDQLRVPEEKFEELVAAGTAAYREEVEEVMRLRPTCLPDEEPAPRPRRRSPATLRRLLLAPSQTATQERDDDVVCLAVVPRSSPNQE